MTRAQARREKRWLRSGVVPTHPHKPRFKVGDYARSTAHKCFVKILKANDRTGWGRQGMLEGFSYWARTYNYAAAAFVEVMEEALRRPRGEDRNELALLIATEGTE